MKDIIVIAIVFAVPLSAIIGAFKVKLKKLELESGTSSKESDERLARVERENAQLRERVGVLESIVTMDASTREARTQVRIAGGVVSEGEEVGVERAEAARRAGR